MIKRLLASIIVVSSLHAACARTGSTKVHRPIAVDLGRFETCRVEIAAPLADGKRATSAFVAYLEGRLRDDVAIEPTDAPSADVLIRIRPGEARSPTSVSLFVEVVLVDEDKIVGSFEVSGEQDDLGGATRRGPRGIALQRAADEIAATMKASTKTSRRRAPPAAPAEPALSHAEDPFAPRSPDVRPPVCLSTCTLPSSSTVSKRELSTLTIRIDPTLQTLRECLHRVGADLVEPAVLLRFGEGGQLVGMRVDVGGFEDLLCVQDVWAAPPLVRTSHPAIVRCLFHCSTPVADEP